MFAACGGKQAPRYRTTMPAVYVVEKKKLPASPAAEPIPPDKDWVVVVMQGEKVPEDGILLSAEKAARAKKWQLSYEELRGLYEADRDVWVQTRLIYEERIDQANKEIQHLQPTWWDSNKGTIAFITGAVMGSALAIGIAYGLDTAADN